MVLALEFRIKYFREVKKVKARYILILISIAALLSGILSSCKKNTVNVILKEDIILLKELCIIDNVENTTSISKGDCIMYIMRSIGMNDDIAEFWSNMCFEVPIFSDINKYVNEPYYGYILAAGYCGLIPSRITDDNINSTIALEPEEHITVQECISIMNQCLGNTDALDNIYDVTFEYSFVKNKSTLYPQKELCFYDMCALLLQFIECDRFKYCDPNKSHSIDEDLAREVTYIEYLKKLQKVE